MRSQPADKLSANEMHCEVASLHSFDDREIQFVFAQAESIGQAYDFPSPQLPKNKCMRVKLPDTLDNGFVLHAMCPVWYVERLAQCAVCTIPLQTLRQFEQALVTSRGDAANG